jgi:hypothetical protein
MEDIKRLPRREAGAEDALGRALTGERDNPSKGSHALFGTGRQAG